jgi:uroporphyrin-III C-methyltransferase
MGLRSRAALSSHLIGRGWSAQTPAAILLSAASATARTWVGTLGELATGVLTDDNTEPGESPGTIVIGQVVSLSYQLGGYQLGVPAAIDDDAEAGHAQASGSRFNRA